jgi:hypothetical protein
VSGLNPQGDMFDETANASTNHNHRCSFCKSYGAARRIECDPPDDMMQVFRFFCASGCQANWETNQVRK